MGKPAARLGDSTAHGGAIVAGAPTVLIGGQPAARMNDMHVCPMLNPGTPPPPHVGQQIILGCPTVLICGQMAARMGDMAMCSGPPDSIVGGCPTVLIGEGGGGGGGGGPAGAAASASYAGGGTGNQVGDSHYLDVKFVDKAGKPIKGIKYQLKDPNGEVSSDLLAGQISKSGVPQGSHEISLSAIASAKWSVADAKVGDKVKLLVETCGIDSGTPATLGIFIRDGNFGDRPLAKIDTKINNDKIEEEWVFQVDDEYLKTQRQKLETGGYSSPLFYFIVTSNDISGRSKLLKICDWIEIKGFDDDGNALGGAKYRVLCADGRVIEGKLDSSGYAKVDKIPPGQVKVLIDPRN
jgi:uncharacterized Zn-binding protein involved in type VI secretion